MKVVVVAAFAALVAVSNSRATPLRLGTRDISISERDAPILPDIPNDPFTGPDLEGKKGFEPDETAHQTVWDAARCKGEQLVAAMLVSDEQAGKIFQRNPPSMRSQWQGDLRQEMAQWGWTPADTDETNSCDFENFWKAKPVTDALGLNAKPKSSGGDNECFCIEHGNELAKDKDGKRVSLMRQTYMVGEKEYMKTGGLFQGVVNRKGGVMFAQYLKSPIHAVKDHWDRDAKAEELPALRSMADNFWGLWYRDNPDVGNIRYFWVQGITNEETNNIIASALRNANAQFGPWPGMTFDTQKAEGQALLGCPNAVAFGYFLIAHKAELGNKWIPKVTVFMADADDDAQFADPDLLFYVEKAPEKKPEDPQGPQEGSIQRRSHPRNLERVFEVRAKL